MDTHFAAGRHGLPYGEYHRLAGRRRSDLDDFAKKTIVRVSRWHDAVAVEFLCVDLNHTVFAQPSG